MTEKIESLRALQARIRQSKGADRELDADVFAAFFPEKAVRLSGQPDYSPDIRMFEYNHQIGIALRVTASLDACLALMAAALPGCEWTRDADGDFSIWREVGTARDALGWLSDAKALATNCHTFLDAIVSAALAEEEAKGEAA